MIVAPYPQPDESYEGFKISYAGGRNGWYIISEKRLPKLYLHKDGTLNEICGSANFFESVDRAKMFIDGWNLVKRQTFISAEEMTI